VTAVMKIWSSVMPYRLPFCLALSLLVAGQASAQQQASGTGGATLSGRVTDRSTGKPVGSARIILRGAERSTVSDSAGMYALSALQPGRSYFVVRAVDFPPQHFAIELREGQRHVRPILLDSTDFGRATAVQALPPIGVSAEAPSTSYRLAGFERRKQTGRGQYLTEDDIIKSGAYNVADAVKRMRGVTYECDAGGCRVRMTRAPMRCMPEYIVDDHVLNDFGPVTPIRDIVALELYTGPADVAGEYAGRNSGCGVIVIWTRSGPDRRRR
jgi:hypothetical protein